MARKIFTPEEVAEQIEVARLGEQEAAIWRYANGCSTEDDDRFMLAFYGRRSHRLQKQDEIAQKVTAATQNVRRVEKQT